ncbi:MAG: HD domain-containing protein [Gammaproteobacteria bacterium]|nr:HD domain-containing protein [Gammaproteobacteria bacterium]
MSFEFPVSFDQEILVQYREELQWAHQELEMLAITLERTPNDMDAVQQIRQIFQELWMSSVKLDLVPISESLQDTLKGLDLLLDWQVYPVSMTEFMLILIDKILALAYEIETRFFIDMRKTQQILVALQYIILAKNPAEISQGIENAVAAMQQEIGELSEQSAASGDIDLFGDSVDLFDDGVELFGDDSSEQPAIQTVSGPDIFVPETIRNPLLQARDYIKNAKQENCLALLGKISDQATRHHDSHTGVLLELAMAMNIMAGLPVSQESLFKGICLHDIALASVPDLLTGKRKLSQDEIEELKLHPVKGAELAHAMPGSDETELLVLHHHERLDGSGYPFGLKGDNISEQGKLAAIVDTFHSILEQNKGVGDRDKVLRAITEINLGLVRQYDALWVGLFNRCIRNYWLKEWHANRNVLLKRTG